jgi:opacity protein-like surface antigen
MKRVIIAVALMVLIIVSASAFADPADTKPYKWTGFYTGLQGSYNFGSTAWDFPDYGTRIDHSLNGGMGGFLVGFNYQTPVNVVVGIESDINYGKITGSSSCPNPNWSCNSEVNLVGSTRFRLGYAINRVLPYIAVGVAYGSAKLYSDDINAGLSVNTYNNYFGWTPSVGLEYAITKNLLARLEYVYYDFLKNQVVFTDGERVDNRIAIQGLKFGLSWKF